MAYQRPMVTVDQNLTITPTSIERDQPAFILGPNYILHRYSDEENRQKIKIDPYTGSPLQSEYPGVVDDEAVDKNGYTELIGDNVVVELEDLGGASLPETEVTEAQRAENGGYTKLLFDNKNYVDSDSSSPYDGLLVKPRVGDILLISYTEVGDSTPTKIRTRIKEIEDYSGDGYNLDDSSSLEAGPGTLITIEDAIPETVSTDSVTVKIVDVLHNVSFDRKNIKNYESGVSDPGYQWEEKEITLENGNKVNGIAVNVLNVLISGYFKNEEWCVVLSSDLYVKYRELDVSYADTFHSVVGAASVEPMLGTVDPDNPLAMGVYMASLNAATDDGDQAPPVYFMAIPKPGKEGYEAVLRVATTKDVAYIFAPTTRDDDVLDLVRNHVLSMSTKTEKMWRIAAASADVPETVDRLNSKMDVDGDDFLAIPVAEGNGGIAPGAEKYDKIRVVKALDSTNGNTDTDFLTTLVPGDRVRFGYYEDGWGETKFDTYVIKRVINNYTVEIDTRNGGIETGHLKEIGSTSYKPSKVEIYHTYTEKERADEIASISKQMGTRRMLNVFPSVFGMNGMTLNGEFAACAVAGLVSATEPQQPITNMSIRGIDDIPLTYQEYSKDELDTIAAGGTFIICQDLPNDKVYVRHQITTAYSDGNLNTAELSITKNVDNISYAFAEVFRPYYGKYNITPDLLATFRNVASKLIDQFAGSTSVYGPQLIADETEILYIRQNELMKDHVDIGIKLGVPYPCNNIDIVLTV